MEANYFTILYWFCHTSTWIHHGYTRAPHPEPSSHLPPRTIPLEWHWNTAVTFDLLGGALQRPIFLAFLWTLLRGEAGTCILLPGHPFTCRLNVFGRGQWFCFQYSWRPLLGSLELLCGPQRRGEIHWPLAAWTRPMLFLSSWDERFKMAGWRVL